MSDSLAELAAAIEGTRLAAAILSSAAVYPAANVAHVFGVILLIGGIGLVDLRIAGFLRELPLAALSRALTPLAVAGLIVMAASGAVLFISDAEALARSPAFRLKLVLIAAALANVILFRIIWRQAGSEEPSALLRASALLSVALWISVATAGRLIAYL